ncbi:MAG TPA: hypothetical protein QF700_09375, partial [Prochlorococcus sp.]|nr:hypothetical protein [Prochlorococcus sp.]
MFIAFKGYIGPISIALKPLPLHFTATFDTSRGDAVLRNWVGLEKASHGTIESARSQVDSLDDIEEMRV